MVGLYKKLIYFFPLFGVIFTLVSCGKVASKESDSHTVPSVQASGSVAPSAAPIVSATGAQIEILSSGELATKVYGAFGPGMTLVPGPQPYDYLIANRSGFTGAISANPTDKFASRMSIGYLMALAGLSSIVGQNYATKLFSGTITNNCTTIEGATAIVSAIGPSMTKVEIDAISIDLVAACKVDPLTAIEALVQSYTFALKSTH